MWADFVNLTQLESTGRGLPTEEKSPTDWRVNTSQGIFFINDWCGKSHTFMKGANPCRQFKGRKESKLSEPWRATQ